MRALHLCAGNLFGGIERMLLTLARHADAAPALRQRFAVCFEGRLAGQLRAAGAAPHVLGRARFSRPWTLWRARRALGRIAVDADVVVAHGAWAHAAFAASARRAGAALACYLHDAPGGRHWVERRAARVRPDLVIANSAYTASGADRLWPGAPVRVVHPPVRLAPASPEARPRLRAALRTGEQDVVVLIAARFEPWKGHGVLLEALSRLLDAPGWTCWIAGAAQRDVERARVEDLRRQAERNGAGARLRWLGHRDDMADVLAAADVLCQPNTAPEPFGIAFVEALAAGLAVVSSRLGAAEEVLGAEAGRLVDAGDAVALAAALRDLIREPKARAALRARGPERARALCDPSAILPALEAALRDAAAVRGRGVPAGRGA